MSTDVVSHWHKRSEGGGCDGPPEEESFFSIVNVVCNLATLNGAAVGGVVFG